MKYKRGLIALFMIICLISITNVSASDVNDTLMAADNDLIENDSVSSSPSADLMSNTDGTFTDLANEIANAEGELNLSRNYVYSNGDSKYKKGIAIDKQITINGNGFNISNGHAFKILARSVTLNNINFIDCHDTTGGAIYWDELADDGILTNCNFVDCYAMGSNGGAVSWWGSNGILSGCSFVDCFVDEDAGGAVSWWGSNGILSGCSFVSCSAYSGGAICWYEESGIVGGCSFVDCSAHSGGAICWYEKACVVSGCSFINCSAVYYGGGIYYTNSDCSLINSSFEGNSAIYGSDWYSPYYLKVNKTTKIQSVLIVPSVITTYGISKDMIVTLRDINNNVLAGEQIIIQLNDNYYYKTTDSKGQVHLSISNITPNEYVANISYVGNSKYKSSNVAANVVVKKVNTILTVPDVNVTRGSGDKLIATLNDIYGNVISGANVEITVGSIDKTLKTNANGQVALDISGLAPGNYTATVESADTDIYNGATATAAAIVYEGKIDTILTIPDVVALYNTSNAIVATLNDASGNVVSGVKVKIVVGSLSKIAKTDVNGQVSMDISGLEIGEYNIAARSAVTDVYNEAKTSAKVTIVDKISTTLIIPDVNIEYGAPGAVVVATLNDASGNVVSGVKVKIVVGSLSKIAKTDVNGQVSMDISGLEIGEYNIAARSAVTDIYNEAKAKATATVSKITPVLDIPNVVTVCNTTGAAVVATLKDAYGNIVSGVKVKLVVGSLSKIAKTDVNGQVSLDISGLEAGEYKISARSAVTDLYNEAKTTATAIVSEDKIDTTLTIPNVEIQQGNGDVVATLKDAVGNVVSGVKVKIVVGELSKIARTDVNGQVSMDISSLAPGEYEIAARSAITDVYNEAKAKATATVSKITPVLDIPNVVTVCNTTGAAVVATLKDAYGNIVSGVKVKLVVGDLSKIAKTDMNGQVSMDISGLAPGEYKISSRSAETDLYNEAKATAKAFVSADKVDTIWTIPDVEIQQGTNGSAIATLKDAYGNIVSGVKVKLVVGSLSKIARTDANGQVSLDISGLEAGEYKISARSAVTDIFNEAKASAKAIVSAD